jgi:hypothetical protein
MRICRISVVICFFLVLGATAAVAGGVVTLLESALVLEAEYEALEAEILACSGGTCPEANDLAAELDALSQELASLQASAAACGCTNATLNTLLQNIAAMDSDLHDIVDSW